MHKSCPAGFKEEEGIIQGQYNCRCSKTDSNIQSCNETTEDVLLKVRSACHVSAECIHAEMLDVHHSATIFIFQQFHCLFYFPSKLILMLRGPKSSCIELLLIVNWRAITQLLMTLNGQDVLMYFNFHAPSPSLVPYRTGYGALPSPTQRVTRSCSPQAVPVVTATASCGTQTVSLSAGSLCLRTWPRGTSSAPATDKVKMWNNVLQLIN